MNEKDQHKASVLTNKENKHKLRLVRIIGTLALIAAIVVLLQPQSKRSSDVKASAETVSQSSSAADNSSDRETKSSQPSDVSSAAEQTTQETGTQLSAKAAANPVSTEVSPKIEVKDGITYVNGILIANKTFALPSDYDPGLSSELQEAFGKMQQAASAEGIQLWMCSGYRSYSYQKQLYDNYVLQDGKAEADRYSARPGHSEHQTGLAVDVNNPSSEFDNTAEAKWLAAHCTDYGFIIRYKTGKESSTGYMAESWHIRYLGDVELCKKIEASGQSLEEYLGITSAYA